MRVALKYSSTERRHSARLSWAAASTNPGNSSIPPRYPVTPCRTISGAAPMGVATTGVPVANASIITSPNGSCHWTGLMRADAPRMSSYFSGSESSPSNSSCGPRTGWTMSRKYSCSSLACILAAMRSGTPASRATATASKSPLSGHIRPTKHTYPPSPAPTETLERSSP
ncbi:hypothetical protein D3C73_1201420 [compost metagenome]